MSTTVSFKAQPALPPPANTIGVIGWLRQNLFSGPFNSLMTLLMLALLAYMIPPLIDWTILKADLSGDSREACTSGGACWIFVKIRLNQFLFGLYPESEYWRIILAFIIVALLIGALIIKGIAYKKYIAAFTLVIYPVIAYYLFSGGIFGLEEVETSKWGGLTLTLILASIGMVAALPLGILLALGRRSDMPITRSICITFIEFWRGVPLITVLFMASVMIPLFLPEGISFDKVLRALIGIALFQSAYMAEVVRGGLQAIPKGQYEAAEALGLTYWKRMYLIILPQALKLVIPGIVNTFIALLKDTTLVLIIGLLDFLNMIDLSTKDTKWVGMAIEGYVFASVIYWILCFSMSRYSQGLERKLHSGHKR